jgi:hypothetical protein
VQLVLLFLLFLSLSANASVPAEIKSVLQQDYPSIKFRLDDLAQIDDKLWLLIKPRKNIYFKEAQWHEVDDNSSKQELGLLQKTINDDYLFSNGWIYTPIKKNTIKSYDYYPESFQKILLQSLITQGFLIPTEFVLPRDLAMLSGRLPLDLGSVELATDRELLYKERLKEEESTKDLEFLAYSVEHGSFSLVSIKRDKNNLSNLESESLTDISSKIKFASKIKKIDGEIYISDQTEAKIYKLNRKRRLDFDATMPLNNEDQDFQEIVNELELFLDLDKYVKSKTGIRDFEFNKNKSNIYILTTIDSKLHIIDTKKEVIIKSVELPASADGMKLVSRSLSEPDKLVFRSRSGARVYIVNTFDYRVSSTLDLDQMNDTYRFIPNDILVTANYILVATEVLYRSPAMPKDSMGKILVIDSVTGKLVSLVDLNFVPFSMAFSADEKTFFAIGSNFLKKTIIAKIDAQTLYLITKADLSPDIIDSKNIASSSAGKFMLVPSAASNLIGVIDLETCTLVKKLDINKTSSVLLAL